MEKIHIILSLAIIGIIVFPACEKENENYMRNDLPNQTLSIQSEMSCLEIRINNFLEKMKGEEEGSLTLDSAVYYLEAGFNYKYSNSGRIEDLSVTQFDTSFVGIQVDSDNLCTYSSINESYNDIYMVMETIFDTLSSDDGKALKILDIEVVQEEEENNKLRVISFWKIRSVSMPGDWIWGQKGGKCDGTYQGLLDATDVIEKTYMAAYTPSFGILHNIGVTPDYYAFEPLMTQNAPTNPFGYFTSLLFYYEIGQGQTVCLLHDEINFYKNRVPEVINRIKDDQGITAQAITVNIGYDNSTTIPNWLILHRARLIYGDIENQRLIDPLDDFISI